MKGLSSTWAIGTNAAGPNGTVLARYGFYGTNNDLSFMFVGPAHGNSWQRWYSNGKTSIGNVAPDVTSKLHLADPTYGGIMLERTSAEVPSKWLINPGHAGSHDLAFINAGQGILTSVMVLAGNKVGINEYYPTATLQVGPSGDWTGQDAIFGNTSGRLGIGNTASASSMYSSSGSVVLGNTGIQYACNVGINRVPTGTLSTVNRGIEIAPGSGGSAIVFYSPNGGRAYISRSDSQTTIASSANIPMHFATNEAVRWSIAGNGDLLPYIDNTYPIGRAGQRITQLFAASATINTSDEREKIDIQNLDLGLDFVNALRPVEFKYRVRQNEVTLVEDGTELVEVQPERTETRIVEEAEYETVEIHPALKDEEGNIIIPAVTEQRIVKEAVTAEVIIPAEYREEIKYKEVATPLPGVRSHAGLIAQEVQFALSGKDIGIFTYDQEADRYGLRYEELVPVLINAVQELSAAVEAQAAKLEAQETLLQQLILRIEALEINT